MKLYDTVALLEDIPEAGLVRGNVGVIIEQYDENAFEVEFSNRENGITYAMVVLECKQMMVLHFEQQKGFNDGR